MYILDFATLLSTLQEISYTGQIEAYLSLRTPVLHGGKVVVTIVRGHATACVILNQQGYVAIAGDQAVQITRSLGVLEWYRAHQSSQPSQEMPVLPPVQQSPAVSPQRQTRPVAPQPTINNQLPQRPQVTNPRLPIVTNPLLPSVTRPLPQISSPQLSPVTNPYLPRMNNQTRSLEAQSTQPHNLLITTCIPQRLVTLHPQILANLERPLRRVLVLVDGQRTIGKIATLLNPTASKFDEVLETLRELERMGMITMART
ncbi:hypothetical protein ccbrp13_55390 [Ktedonobacteria bacterium brp13]|nr:hypothetical protein ccbrp13_55390 [Ktedonobacteria bacterium brp13]